MKCMLVCVCKYIWKESFQEPHRDMAEVFGWPGHFWHQRHTLRVPFHVIFEQMPPEGFVHSDCSLTTLRLRCDGQTPLRNQTDGQVPSSQGNNKVWSLTFPVHFFKKIASFQLLLHTPMFKAHWSWLFLVLKTQSQIPLIGIDKTLILTQLSESMCSILIVL